MNDTRLCTGLASSLRQRGRQKNVKPLRDWYSSRPARSLVMKPLIVTLLGGFEIRGASGQIISLPTKKTLALLGYLALRPGKAYPRDRLAALLWGDSADEQARKSLRQAMYVLRKTLPETEPPALLMEGETIALNGDAVDVDASAFERLVSERTPEALERAVALYRGELL